MLAVPGSHAGSEWAKHPVPSKHWPRAALTAARRVLSHRVPLPVLCQQVPSSLAPSGLLMASAASQTAAG